MRVEKEIVLDSLIAGKIITHKGRMAKVREYNVGWLVFKETPRKRTPEIYSTEREAIAAAKNFVRETVI